MVHEPTLRQVALDYPIEKRTLEKRVERLEKYVQDNLSRLYSDATSENRDGVLLVDERPHRIIIGLRGGRNRVMRNQLNVDDDGLEPVQEYYRTRARSLLPDDVVETDILRVCTPVVAEMPDWWKPASLFIQNKLSHLSEQELTAAEVLDYFVVEYLEIPPSRWADSRGVSSTEAVRKNARQARSKLDDS